MAGDSMDWAAVGCQQLVNELRDGDEFSITRFGSNVDHWMRHLARATPRNRAEYARRLLNVVADLGGTEMEQALRAAAKLSSRQERSEVVLLTDGEIWASDALVRWARGTGLRVFVIGIGASPNQPFLKRLADETGGSCDFVSPGEDMIRAIQRVMARLRQPRRETLPAMWPAQPDWTLQLPAVAHAGQTVHVIAGFEAAPIGEAVIAGTPVALPGAHDRRCDVVARRCLPAPALGAVRGSRSRRGAVPAGHRVDQPRCGAGARCRRKGRRAAADRFRRAHGARRLGRKRHGASPFNGQFGPLRRPRQPSPRSAFAIERSLP